MMDFGGQRVVGFESRRAAELARLVEAHHGVPLIAPALRELPLEPGPDVVELAARLRRKQLDGVLFLSPGGVRVLPDAMAGILATDTLLSLLSALPLGARGEKTKEALVAMGLGEAKIIVSDEPHTWHELLDAWEREQTVVGTELALIEHGVAHGRLKAALEDVGAQVLSVALYRWALPDDVGPLLRAIDEIVVGRAAVVLFTSGAQIDGVMGVAAEQDLDEPLREALSRAVVGAVGNVTADRLRAFGIEPDVIPLRPRMADLVRDAAGCMPKAAHDG
jgi:uroporphyrinogen-III synthase